MKKTFEEITQRIIDFLVRVHWKASTGAFILSGTEGPDQSHFSLALDRDHCPMSASLEVEFDGMQMLVIDSRHSHFDSKIGHALRDGLDSS